MRADIHNGQEHKRSVQGPDTEPQDLSLPFIKSDLQRTAGPYSRVIRDQMLSPPVSHQVRSRLKADLRG